MRLNHGLEPYERGENMRSLTQIIQQLESNVTNLEKLCVSGEMDEVEFSFQNVQKVMLDLAIHVKNIENKLAGASLVKR
jgi:hypothetical protein